MPRGEQIKRVSNYPESDKKASKIVLAFLTHTVRNANCMCYLYSLPMFFRALSMFYIPSFLELERQKLYSEY